MSLAKIPFILLATWAFNACLKSPTPRPPKHERIASRLPMEYARHLPISMRILQWCFAIAEIATILASANRSTPLSQLILSSIVWNDGKPENLRMSNGSALGLVLMVSATLIRLTTYRYLGRFFRFELSIQKDHELIVSGPYSVVRHPGYTGTMLVFTGWFPWQFSKGSWLMESGFLGLMFGRALIVAYISFIFGGSWIMLGRLSKEDATLRKQFGKKWDDWAKRVPYSILPGLY